MDKIMCVIHNVRSKVMRSAAHAAARAGYSSSRRAALFVGVPAAAVALATLNVYIIDQNRTQHTKPAFVEYPYLRIRTKRFPWGDGDKSLFHNREVNALPSGYER